MFPAVSLGPPRGPAGLAEGPPRSLRRRTTRRRTTRRDRLSLWSGVSCRQWWLSVHSFCRA